SGMTAPSAAPGARVYVTGGPAHRPGCGELFRVRSRLVLLAVMSAGLMAAACGSPAAPPAPSPPPATTTVPPAAAAGPEGGVVLPPGRGRRAVRTPADTDGAGRVDGPGVGRGPRRPDGGLDPRGPSAGQPARPGPHRGAHAGHARHRRAARSAVRADPAAG